MELAKAVEVATPEPTYQVVCYGCQYEGTAQGTGPRDTGCPHCDFPLITATDMSPPAFLQVSPRSSLLPGVEAPPPPPAFEPMRAPLAIVPVAPTRASSMWSSVALCGFAVVLGIAAKAMQAVF